jgi:plastocyanin
MKNLLMIFVSLSLLTLAIAACTSGSGTGSSATNAGTENGNYTVHLSEQNFVQSAITISKGSSITLVDDAATPHIIANGSWTNGSPQPMQESGMPAVSNLQISGSGSSQTIGPFNTPGTYHLYCTVHPGMDLTVTVQ